MTHHLLFTYGTLKKGQRNHYVLARSGAELVCEYAISLNNNFRMQEVGFPILFPVTGGAGFAVRGEIYRINDALLEACDRLENRPRMYDREIQMFSTGATSSEEAWIYLWKLEQTYAPVKPIRGVYNWNPRKPSKREEGD